MSLKGSLYTIRVLTEPLPSTCRVSLNISLQKCIDPLGTINELLGKVNICGITTASNELSENIGDFDMKKYKNACLSARCLNWRGNPVWVKLGVKTSLLLFCFLITCLHAQGWNPEEGLILEGDVVTMNRSLEVIKNGKVVIRNDRIIAVLKSGEVPSKSLGLSKALIVKTNDWIFPGLIDAHSHTEYNVLPLWKVPKQYNNRYQWQKQQSYKDHVRAPINLFRKKGLKVELVKYAEIKAIVGGVTSIQGSPDLRATRILVRNIEHNRKHFRPDQIETHVVPSITDTSWQKKLKNGLLKKIANDSVDAFLVHLAEGTDDSSRAEFDILKKLGLLGKFTVVIHGTALKQNHFQALSKAGGKLVWSPLSNLLLYGQTTNIPEALKQEIIVCLSSDWSPSGSKNLLGEMKVAHLVDEYQFKDVISDTALVRMVTANPALALGLQDSIGQIKKGLYADIVVFAKADSKNPYSSLIKSNERHVSLVLIGGKPVYGDHQIMKSLKPGDFEILPIGGMKKAIDITDSTVKDKGDQKMKDILQKLRHAIQSGNLSIQPDPISPFGDTYFFKTIRNSRNIKDSGIDNLGFKLSQYWPKSKKPPAVDTKVIRP